MPTKGLNALLWILAGIGIFLRVWSWAGWPREHFCVSDFPAFYAGAQLLGTPDLYRAEAAIAVQQRAVGCASVSSAFIRPPFFAMLVWPFAQLPFTPAFFAWGAVSLAALVAFVWIWDAPKPFAACCCSWLLPVAGNFAAGQDVAFLLLWLAIAARLVRTGRPFTAGAVLSLCSAKFHLFLLLPLLIAGRRMWRLAAGLAAGGGLLFAVSALLAGPRWITAYNELLQDPRIEPHPWDMVNLRAAVHGFPGAGYWEAALAVSAAVACWVIVRRSPFPLALAAVVTAGLLVSRHSYAPDASLLLLPALTVPFLRESAAAKMLAVAPVVPLTWFVGVIPGMYRFPRFVPLLLLYALALERRGSPGGPQRSPAPVIP